MQSTTSSMVAVAWQRGLCAYAPLDQAPYHPATAHPEYVGPVAGTPNPAYDLFRETLSGLGLDGERKGTADWNPLGALVKPGAKIVIKPNWVLDHNEGKGGTDCLITHASVIRAAVDYALLTGPNEVVVGDAPIQLCNWDALQALGFAPVANYFSKKGSPVRTRDFRRTISKRGASALEVSESLRPMEDYVLVDLGQNSLLEPISSDADRFRVTMYDPRKLKPNHQPGVHRYLVARDILEADLIINLPKLKTHKKAGITAALKNLVGINGNKDYLPHHRKGAANRGGDNYAEATLPKTIIEALLDLANRHLNWPRFYSLCSRFAYKWLFFDKIRNKPLDVEGGWYGNDTVWRMCLDLNKILLYADVDGKLCDKPQRTVLSISDALIAGEGDGPLASESKPFGAMIGSLNPAAHDWVAAQFMGLNPSIIPITQHAFDPQHHPIASFVPEDIQITLNGQRVAHPDPTLVESTPFIPPIGWRGHI